MPISRVFVDMDEVLTDFVRGALLTHKRSPIDIRTGEWDLCKPLGLTEDAFWEPIHERGEQFWTGLIPHSWMNGLLRLVKDVDPNWVVLSSPSCCPTSYSGKAKWLKKRFGSGFNRFSLFSQKELFAREDRLLIDDREENCIKWEQAGGKSILFPSGGNRLYSLREDPLPYVFLELEKLLDLRSFN